MQIASSLHPRGGDVASILRFTASAAPTGLALDEAAPAAAAPALGARRAGARDRRRTRAWHLFQRRHRQDPSPRHRGSVALRRETWPAQRRQAACRRLAPARTSHRVLVPQRPAAGLGCKRKTSSRNYARRRAYPAPPAPLAGRIEREPLPMAGRRSAVFPLLLLWGAAGTEQALLRRALRARVPGCTRAAARHCAIAILRAPSTPEQNRQGNRRSNPSGE
jgi:hypothetical protein